MSPGGPTADPGWILWAGTVGLEGALTDRVEAALAGGYARLSLSPLDVARAGRPARALGAELRSSGLELVLDPVMNWYADPPPPGSRFGRFSADEALEMAEALEVVALTVIGAPTCSVPLAEPFAAVCDRAAGFDAQVHLEFMPMSAIRDLRTAWEIVQQADRDNGGLVLDTWHFFRGDPDLELLATVPGERVFAVQVDDAHAVPRGTLREETVQRLLPGDGDLDLLGVLRVLDRTGGLSWVGPEVISPVTAAMPPVEAARLAGDRVRDLVARARAR